MHTINGEEKGWRGGGDAFTSRILYIQSSRLFPPRGIGNSSIVDIRRSSTDRKIEGKRSSSLRRKKKNVSLSPSFARTRVHASSFPPDIRLLNRGLEKNYVSWRPDSYLERDSRACGGWNWKFFHRRSRIGKLSGIAAFISVSYGIFYLYILVPRTAFVENLYTVPRLDGNFFRTTPRLINRAKKDIITSARKNENIDPRCDNPRILLVSTSPPFLRRNPRTSDQSVRQAARVKGVWSGVWFARASGMHRARTRGCARHVHV